MLKLLLNNFFFHLLYTRMTALLEIVDIDILTPKSLPNIGVYKILLHIVQFVLAFIVLCLSATVISSERAYYVSKMTTRITCITQFIIH